MKADQDTLGSQMRGPDKERAMDNSSTVCSSETKENGSAMANVCGR